MGSSVGRIYISWRFIRLIYLHSNLQCTNHLQKNCVQLELIKSTLTKIHLAYNGLKDYKYEESKVEHENANTDPKLDFGSVRALVQQCMYGCNLVVCSQVTFMLIQSVFKFAKSL